MPAEPARPATGMPRWFAWLIGAAMLAALVALVWRRTEQREFVRLVAEARPVWLAFAALLQATTYLAQSFVWTSATAAAGHVVPRGLAYRLCVAKLFVDQALPSAGVGGTVVMVKALEGCGVPRRLVMASVVVSTASYYGAYALAVAAALAVGGVGRLGIVLVVLGAAFVAAALLVVVLVLVLPQRWERVWRGRLRRVPVVRTLLAAIADGDRDYAHRPGVLVRATAWQAVIIALDAATLWSLLAAIGVQGQPAGVFASYVLASVCRTLALVPAGLGVFEASSVALLHLAGIAPLPALSATLLYRGYSLWAPMVAGMVLARRFSRVPQ